MSEETTTMPAAPVAASSTGGENGAKGLRADKDGVGEGKLGKRSKRKKVSYLTINKIYYVDYKDTATLKRFINDRGKILSTKVTGNTAKQQRMITTQVKRAREMALLPFIVSDPVADRGPFKPRGPREDRAPRDNRETAVTEAPAATEE